MSAKETETNSSSLDSLNVFKPDLFIFLKRGKCILLTFPDLVTIKRYVSSSKLETVSIAVTFSLGAKLIIFETGVPLEVLD